MSHNQKHKKIGNIKPKIFTNDRDVLKADIKCSLEKTLNLSAMDDSFTEFFESSKAPSKTANDTNAQRGFRNDEENLFKLNQSHNVNETEVKKTNIDENITDEIQILKDYFGSRSLKTTSDKAKKETAELFVDNIVQYCPICLKKNHFDPASGFVTHLKSCAFRNNVKTEQLIKAIKLQEKQITERVALGLPSVAKEKQNSRKTSVKKKPLDSNLELAMALSASLRESEMLIKLKETETLLEAGLEQEAMSQCKQLEDFGFMSSKPVDSGSQKSTTSSKQIRNTVLFTRSQEERERIITEKIAIILVDSDTQINDSHPETYLFSCNLKSRFLKIHQNEKLTLWKKSYQLNEDAADENYYVKNLSNFVSPCKIRMGEKLKHVSQIPCRLPSPDKNVLNKKLSKLSKLFSSNDLAIDQSTGQKAENPAISNHCGILTLSADWKTMLNKNLMSDVTIYTKNERSIHAHKLVIYARCRSILSDAIKEVENNQCTEILMWMEYHYEAAVAFLEYIYTGITPDLQKLNENQMEDLKNLCLRYQFIELKNLIDTLCARDEMFALDEVENNSYKVNQNISAFSTLKSSRLCIENNETSFSTDNISQSASLLYEGEKNLLSLQKELQTQEANAASPEILNEYETSSTDSEIDEKYENKTVNETETLDLMSDFESKHLRPDEKILSTNEISSGHRFDLIGNSESSADKATDLKMDVSNSSTNKSFIENIISSLCSPVNSPKIEHTFEFSELNSKINTEMKHWVSSSSLDDMGANCVAKRDRNINANDRCIDFSLNDNFKSDTCFDDVQKKFEKRKSYSPLEKNTIKKSKKTCSTCELNSLQPVEIFGMKNERSKSRKRIIRRKKTSQSYSLSDSCTSENSNEELNSTSELDHGEQHTSSRTLSLKNKSTNDKVIRTKIEFSSLTDDDIFLEADDFQELISKKSEGNDYICEINSENKEVRNRNSFLIGGIDFNLKIENNQDAKQSPYVSPVWDGFENANCNYLGVCYSPQSSIMNNFVDLTFSPPLEALSSPKTGKNKRQSSTDEKSVTACDNRKNERSGNSCLSQPNFSSTRCKSVNEVFFESFAVDETLLNKLENNTHETKSNIKTPEIRTGFSEDVRKFKCRSKSDTCFTPTTKCVTPLPDYSNMKLSDLKKELDKYGLKPGIGRSKAKQLLRYIYDQLHPFDNEINLSESSIRTSGSNKTPFIHKSPNKKESQKSVYTCSDSDDSGSTISTGVAVLEQSFVEDKSDARTQDVTENIASKAVTLDIGFQNLIREDKSLHTQILLYEPIWLEPLKIKLKENGVKCNVNDLINYLDEKCITFRTKQQRGDLRKKKKKKLVKDAKN